MKVFSFGELLIFFGSFGVIKSRMLPAGIGIFCNGDMFALIKDSKLHLRATKGNEQEFNALQMQPYSYKDKETAVTTEFYAIPENWWENSSELSLQVDRVLSNIRAERLPVAEVAAIPVPLNKLALYRSKALNFRITALHSSTRALATVAIH